VRSASRIAAAGTVAASSPANAHIVRITVACATCGSVAVPGLNGRYARASTNHSASSPNSSSGSSFSAVTTTCIRPASRRPAMLTAAQAHSAASAHAAPRAGVAVSAGKIAPMLPAKPTAIAASPDQIEIQ
jgi:hypothetical protein